MLEERLLRQQMSESESRIEELVRAKFSALVRFAKHWKDGVAEDVVQEAFLKLMRQKDFPENPAAWLYKTVRNLANSEHRSSLRRRKRELEVQTYKGLVDISESDQDEGIVRIIKGLESLDRDCRSVIIGKVWEGLTLEEIAEKMGMHRSSVYRKYQEGIQRLREVLGES